MNIAANRLDEIFWEASQLAAGEPREAYLARACGEDRELRQRLEQLLQAQPKVERFLERPFAGPAATVDLPAACEKPGAIIGPYKLLESIGEGGMGTVWMAQQTEPVKRSVAVKLIKAGMDSRQVLARFGAERQALALMDHPNIAKVHDAGTTPDGRPYFVMELVKGVPITRYCDERRLTPRQRLELFVPVCHAIQHAHQKSIIHRDIKPSNVLVALYDDRPVPKVIDFGVAKATGAQLTENSLHTGFGAVVGTLEYMSPEQASFNQLDVDTRSDVYSLGVLLYELLAGSPPFGRKELEKADYLEMLRVLREQEPSKPSTKLSTAEGLPTLAANRGTEPAKLTKLVRGELDWIVMKALEKDRNRRYETVNGFAMDVQRYLADEPVLAGPPSAAYRLRKFVRRNRGPVAAATAVASTVLLALVGFAVLSLLIWREKEQTGRQRDRAEANAKEARARQQEAEQARQRTREALNTLTVGVIANLFAKQPRLGEDEKQFLRKVQQFYEEAAAEQGNTEAARASKADGYCRVASIRKMLGELAEAEHSYVAGLAVYSQLVTDFPTQPKYRLELARRQEELASLLRRMGRPQKSEAAFRAVLDMLAELPPNFSASPLHRQLSAQTQSNLGILLYGLGRVEEAKTVWQTALGLQTELAEAFPGEAEYRAALGNTYNNLGHLFLASGHSKAAEQAFRAALERRAQLVKDFPSMPNYRMTLAMTQGNLAVVLHGLGQVEEALKVLRAARNLRADLARDFPTVPDFRHDLAQSYKNLALMLHGLGRKPEAMTAFQDALNIQTKLIEDFRTVPEYRDNLALIHNDLGSLHRGEGRLGEAEAAHRAARDIWTELVKEFGTNPDYANYLAGTLVNMANVARDRKQHTEARKLLEQAVPYHLAALKANPKNPAYSRYYRNNMVEMVGTMIQLGDHVAAVLKAEELLGLDVLPADDTYNAACAYARCVPLAAKDSTLAEIKRRDLAAAYASRAMALLRQAIAKGYRDIVNMKQDSDLDPLRGRADFKTLMADLKKPSMP